MRCFHALTLTKATLLNFWFLAYSINTRGQSTVTPSKMSLGEMGRNIAHKMVSWKGG
jgi:hypothetical protein